MMDSYSDNLRKVKSLLIVTSLQKRRDIKAFEILRDLEIDLNWESLSTLMIDKETWDYVTIDKKYDPKFVFCHPETISKVPTTSLYYRGLTGLSIKAAKGYFGSVESFENGKSRSKMGAEKALKMARVYNTFICSIIKGSTAWTLENGKRTIIATLGITLDGVMRNKVGTIAEERVRSLIYEWLKERSLIEEEIGVDGSVSDILPKISKLPEGIIMRFSSEPDISFSRKTEKGEELLAVVEIKGGIDSAGALERYGAATKSFQHSLQTSQKCKNFFLSAVYTPELQKRIQNDRLVEKFYDIIKILEEPEVRDDFFKELFHYTLRLT
jgi:hypothetical protein